MKAQKDIPVIRRRVAIVGASYAGAGLANYLMQHRVDEAAVEVDLFDALHEPDVDGGGKLVGNVHLPDGERCFRAMGLKWPWKRECNVPEEQTLQILRSARVLSSTRYRTKIEHVRSSSSGKLLLCTQLKTISDAQFGPYDLVVAANGVRSKFRHHQAEHRVLLLGDARFDHMWDFGVARLQRGANRALLDAVELGQLLVRQQSEDKGDNLASCCDSKFSSLRKRRKTQQLLCLLVAVAVAFSAILLSGYRQQEQ